jgi:hypothetical protein
VRLHLEPLETRDLLSSGLTLTPLVQVSDPSPLPPPASTTPTVFVNSEVEPQLAVNPVDTTQAVAVWQQDRYRSGGGARALVVSVTADADNPLGAHWSTPTAIPGFDATASGAAYGRYTDPWVSIGPDGKVYATALAIDIPAGFPSTSASLVITGSITVTGGVAGISWAPAGPTTLIRNQAPAGTDPVDLANDKEMVVADPNVAGSAYVIWDRLDHPSDQQNFNAFHGLAFREDALFARTTDGGATWHGSGSPPATAGYPASDLTNFQANQSAFGNQIVVQPDGTLVDVFTYANGSGNQKPQADQNTVGVMRSTDHGLTWSAPLSGPGIEVMPVTDPDTGAAVRDGDPLLDVTVDPRNGNLYAVWADGRFSGFAHDDIAFSMSTDGGLTWSAPIKVNQTPTNIPDGDQQAFTPSVAVNSDGVVAVSYYDFRNNTAAAGLPTDYWLAHASSNLTSPGSWTAGELRLTDTSFNMEKAAPTSRGYFLGDYEGLAAAGKNFYALFAQAGAGSSDPSNIWFRDPPPAPGAGAALAVPAPAAVPQVTVGVVPADALVALGPSAPSPVVAAAGAPVSSTPAVGSGAHAGASAGAGLAGALAAFGFSFVSPAVPGPVSSPSGGQAAPRVADGAAFLPLRSVEPGPAAWLTAHAAASPEGLDGVFGDLGGDQPQDVSAGGDGA